MCPLVLEESLISVIFQKSLRKFLTFVKSRSIDLCLISYIFSWSRKQSVLKFMFCQISSKYIDARSNLVRLDFLKASKQHILHICNTFSVHMHYEICHESPYNGRLGPGKVLEKSLVWSTRICESMSDIYIYIFHAICTFSVCCALSQCVCRSAPSVSPYPSGLLHWHWGNHDCPSASEVTLKDMGKKPDRYKTTTIKKQESNHVHISWSDYIIHWLGMHVIQLKLMDFVLPSVV